MKQVKHHNVFIYYTKYKSSLVMVMNKTFSKSYIIRPLELELDYVVFNYCLLDTTCFTNAEDNFIRVTSLRGRTEGRLLQTSLHNWTNVINKCHHPLGGEDYVKMAYTAELLSRNQCWGSKTMSKSSNRPRHTKTGE